MAEHTIALLGTGIMGAGMGRSMLREGLAVRAWNRTSAKAEPLAKDGATVWASPEEAVKGAQVILTMLTDTDAVIEVADRVLGGAEDGAVWLQMSTIGVEGSDRAAQVASRHGGGPLDAPYAQLTGKAMVSHDYPASFPLANARKDAHLALEGGAKVGLLLNLGATTAKIYDMAMAAGYGDHDVAASREVVGRPLDS